MEDNVYIFKCTHKKGEHHCDGEHVFVLDDEFCRKLIDRLVFGYKFYINEELIFKIISDFEKFVKNKLIDNKAGKDDWRHWYTIDVDAELLCEFSNLKFGSVSEFLNKYSLPLNKSDIKMEYTIDFEKKGGNNKYKIIKLYREPGR